MFNPIRHVSIQFRRLRAFAVNELLAHRIQYHHPTLRCEYPVIWRYGWNWLDSIEIGQNVYVMAYAELLVYKHTSNSPNEGRLVLRDGAVVATGVNIRAAGGKVVIGRNSGIGEYAVVVASNHAVHRGVQYIKSPWDAEPADVILGENVWVGAHSCLLPGVRIGDNSVVGAGSVVRGEIPPDEIWAGVPARKIRDVPTAEEHQARRAALAARSRPTPA